MTDQKWICSVDGDNLCIVGKDFKNLQESKAVFIPLKLMQVLEIGKLTPIKGIQCPICKDDGYDEEGLQNHYDRGWCK